MKYGPQTELVKHPVTCPKHGKTHCAAFLMPEPYEAQVAHYECGHCWDEAGRPDKTEWRGATAPPHKGTRL